MTRKPFFADTLDFVIDFGATQTEEVAVPVAVADEAAESVARVFPILEFLQASKSMRMRFDVCIGSLDGVR